MSTLKDEIEQFARNRSENDLKVAIGELLKKVLPSAGGRAGIPIRDGEDRSVGFLLMDEAIENPDLSDYQTFLAVARYRIANPPESYLSADGFLAELANNSH